MSDQQTETLNLPESPLGLLPEIWAELENAIQVFAHPWRTPTLATVSNDVPKVRTIVLRDFDSNQRQFVCHTDRRSAKVAQITNNSNVGLHFYDSESKIQIQFYGTATIQVQGELFNRIWEQASASQRLMYLAPHSPGIELSSSEPNLPSDIRIDELDISVTESGKQNFCVIVIEFDELEWLRLHPAGNRRARVRWTDDGISGEWIAA